MATRLLGYGVTELRGYAATSVKKRVRFIVAFLFRLMDYCFGTLIKEQVKFLCSALFFHELDSCVAFLFRLMDYSLGTLILKNELNSCVACFFRLKDYCFGTWIKEQVKFLCSALFSTWKNKHNVRKPRPRSYLAPS